MLRKTICLFRQRSSAFHLFSVAEISMMTNAVLDWISIEDGHHLTDFNQPFLSCASLRTYANAIHQEGAVFNNCWGFIYRTVRSVCCPLQNQRIVCNGHKRVHALKFQPTVTPNGLIANLYGPVCEWKYTCIQKVIIKLNLLSFPGYRSFHLKETLFLVSFTVF